MSCVSEFSVFWRVRYIILCVCILIGVVTFMVLPRRYSTPSYIRLMSSQSHDQRKPSFVNATIPFDKPCIQVSEIKMALQPALKVMRANYKKQLEMKSSNLYILGTKSVYEIDDVVRININLYNKDGRLRQFGGDQLNVRIFEDDLGASAAGHVIDHRNGSYTATVKCLWTGTPTIEVYLIIDADMTKSIDNFFTKVPSLSTRVVTYKGGEQRRCYPFKHWFSGTRSVCNMTKRNGGMSWFCESPTKATCDDVINFHYCNMGYALSPQLNFSHGILSPTFKVQVKGKSPATVTSPPQIPCGVYDRAKLWTMPSPVGFFYRHKWTLLHCTAPRNETFVHCLRNKHLVLYGDSTVRQWFSEMKNRFNCKMTSEQWTYPLWVFNSSMYCSINNLTIEIIFHSLPGNVGSRKTVFTSISESMLQFYKRKGVIFLLSINLHLTSFHEDTLRDRLQHIRESVDIILAGDPDATILVKGIAFRWHRHWLNVRQIVREYYEGIRDKVVYLDSMDMTLAGHSEGQHPPKYIVNQMVDQMFGYICM